jgi:hypothetical protein
MALPAIWHSSPAELFVNYVRCYLRAASDREADYGGRVSILRTALVRRRADCDWLNNRNTLSNPGTRQEVSNEVISKIESAIYSFASLTILSLTLAVHSVELNTWKEALPPEVEIKLSNRATATPHRIMLELSFWWLFILLHRPFYRRSRPAPGSEDPIDHVKVMLACLSLLAFGYSHST